ncbi:hypothetical protein BDFG_07836 [Blastomyces dermatitidis ATCC 26199]|nr:hypothetical protein BDFG_07836 [Blastomyces dermatitidis ATCC 26199]
MSGVCRLSFTTQPTQGPANCQSRTSVSVRRALTLRSLLEFPSSMDAWIPASETNNGKAWRGLRKPFQVSPAPA